MNISNYKDDDFNAVLELLNSSKEYDSFSEALLKEKLYDDPFWNPQNTFVAKINDNIVGFMQGVTRLIRGTKYGYIKLMAVDKDNRRKGIASQLFNKIEINFKKEKIEAFRIYDVPLNYFMPGIDLRYTAAICFAQKLGFKHISDAINMTVNLEESNWDTEEQIKILSKDKIEVTRTTDEDKIELFNFISDEWALWQNELEMAYKSQPIAIYIAKLKGEIKAFSAYDGNNVGTGWFGPMGTHPDLRGKGIGKALLYLCLTDIKKQGLKKATIPWVAPISFYSNLANAKISRVFWRFEKQLSYE